MSRIPQPSGNLVGARRPWRPEPKAADYSDEISDKDFEALKKAMEKECSEKDYQLVDGPAW